jgi:hypothetical protein
MARSLERRVAALEAAWWRCPECSFDGEWGRLDLEVEWDDSEEEGDEPEENEYCPGCGRATVIVVRWVDLPGAYAQ